VCACVKGPEQAVPFKSHCHQSRTKHLSAHPHSPPPLCCPATHPMCTQFLALLNIIFGIIWGASLLFLFLFIWLPLAGFFGARWLKPGTHRNACPKCRTRTATHTHTRTHAQHTHNTRTTHAQLEHTHNLNTRTTHAQAYAHRHFTNVLTHSHGHMES
jgi:hypothetical protein